MTKRNLKSPPSGIQSLINVITLQPGVLAINLDTPHQRYDTINRARFSIISYGEAEPYIALRLYCEGLMYTAHIRLFSAPAMRDLRQWLHTLPSCEGGEKDYEMWGSSSLPRDHNAKIADIKRPVSAELDDIARAHGLPMASKPSVWTRLCTRLTGTR